MNPDRFQAFAEAYVVAIRDAAVVIRPHLAALSSPEVYALGVVTVLLDQLERGGGRAIEGYGINQAGGAFQATARALGVDATAQALQDYLDGK